ncbi:MAG: response regulator receiver [Sphingomonadales bacterium]|nr:response regulator receiver [Sphingomonadales bacterium]
MPARLNILIVEDEALLAMDIEAIVEDVGYNVIGTAISLSEVQRFPESFDPHVAFVDMHLAEGSNGLEVTAHIRKLWPCTIIIFLTANVKKIPLDFAGAHGVIAKPFSRAGLISALHYLEQGICDPPPSSVKPSSLQASPTLSVSWAQGR